MGVCVRGGVGVCPCACGVCWCERGRGCVSVRVGCVLV